MHEIYPSQEYLQSIFNYDPETGHFTRKVKRGRSWTTDRPVGGNSSNGYIRIGVDHIRYHAHRLAFIYMTGDCPPEVDHINGVRTDNRWSNLRAATRATNARNLSIPSNNTSGHIGVRFIERLNKWRAEIWRGKNIYLGVYGSFEEACKARKDAETKLGFHKNHGERHA